VLQLVSERAAGPAPVGAVTGPGRSTIVAGSHANGNPPSLTAYALCGA